MTYFNNAESNTASSTSSSFFGGESAAILRSPAQIAAYEAFSGALSDDRITNADKYFLRADKLNPGSGVDDLNGMANRLNAFLTAGFSPFPFSPTRENPLVFLFVDTVPQSHFAATVYTLVLEGKATMVYGTYNSQDKVVEGREITVPFYEMGWDALQGVPTMDMEKPTYTIVLAPYNELLHGDKETVIIGPSDKNWNHPYAHEMGWYFAKHLVGSLSHLSDEALVSFVKDFAGMTEKAPGVLALKPYDSVSAAYVECLFDFNTGVITTTREFKQRKSSYISEIGELRLGVSMALQAIELGGYNGISQRELDGLLAFRTQVWEEEDNYGAEMFDDEQLRAIRNNTLALLKAADKYSFPYFRLEDNNTSDGVGEACKWLHSVGREFFIDKNGSKRVIIDEGVTALMLGFSYMEDGAVAIFVTDVAKESKTLNRNWQAVAIRAMEGLVGSEGYRPYEKSALRVMKTYDDGRDPFTVGVTGDKTKVLFHNGRMANNGSGVGISRREFSYMVYKTFRGQVSAIHLKDGQTLEKAQVELEKKLEALIKERRVLKGSDAKFKREVLSYNGIPVLAVDPGNCEYLLDPKLCSYNVRFLASSRSVSIELTVPYFASDYEIKGRGLGIKAVFQKASDAYVIFNEDGSEEKGWECSANMETQKGQVARLTVYCEYLRDQFGGESFLEFGVVPNDKTGKDQPTAVLHYPVGNGEYMVQDLSDIHAPFYQWQRETMKVYYVEEEVNMYYFTTTVMGQVGRMPERNNLQAVWEAVESEEWNDISLIDKYGKVASCIEDAIVVNEYGQKAVRVRERVEGILGDYPLMVECATRREASASLQASTLEAMAATWASNPRMGEAMAKLSVENTEAVVGMVAMATNNPSVPLDVEDYFDYSDL